MKVPDTTSSLSEEVLVVECDSRGSKEGENGSCGVDDDEESEENNDQSSEDRSEEHATATPENKNDNKSNSANSSTRSFASLEKSDSKNEEDSSYESGFTDDSSEVQTLSFPQNWSETLNSPKDLLGFSPSEAGDCHGLGLQMAVERSVDTSLFLGSVSVFLSTTAALYEQLGVNLVKMAHLYHPRQLRLETSINDDFQSLHEDILSLGGDFRSIAEWYRDSIVAPLKKLLSTNGTERDTSIKRYKELRKGSVEARKLALANYSRLKDATKTAEDEIQAWITKLEQKGTDEENQNVGANIDVMDKDLPWEKALKLIGKRENKESATSRLIEKLKLVQSYRTLYSESVEQENKCVISSQESESVALSRAQKAEEDQMNFLLKDVLSQVFPKDENGGNLPVARTSIKIGDTARPFTEDIEKKGIELLSNLSLFKQQNMPYEEGMGVMDAETLGLPESLGIQRDKIKSSFSARENRIEVTETVVKLFGEIATVTSKSSLRMLSQITNQRRKDASKDSTSESFYSLTVGSIWQKTLSVFEDEAKHINEVAFKVTELEKWLTMSKRILENDIEVDDAAWKRVCNAARMEMKLESRYKQTKQHLDKVRQRASSKELFLSRTGSSDSSDDPSPSQSQRKRIDSFGSIGLSNRSTSTTPIRVPRAFLKGSEAMKKFTENAMTQIAQIGMNEVDQKEAKDQLALEEATAGKKSAMLAYESSTKERIEKIDSEDQSGWMEMREIILKLSTNIRGLKSERCTVFQNRISQELESSFQPLIGNMEEWSKSVQEKIHQSERDSSLTNSPGYVLSVQPIESDSIDQFLRMTETDLAIPKLKIDIQSTNDCSKASPSDSEEVTPPSGRDEKDDVSSDDEVEKPQKPIVAKSDHSRTDSESEEEKTEVPASSEDNAAAEKEESSEVKAFIKQFWSKKPEDEKMPTILDIFTCAYRPKERITFLTTDLQGRLYTTKEAIYFLAADKNFTLNWERIISVEKEKGFMGSINETDLVVTYRSVNITSSFLLCRLKDRDNVVANLQRLKAESEQSEVSQVSESTSDTGAQLPSVPPDALLKNMEIVVARTIKNVSIESVFEKVWADRNENESFYESWLKEEECFDIGMGEWKIAEPGQKFRNEWCNEEYDQQRLVTFKFNRTTHLYIGPPVANVKQRHFIRVEDNDRCVLAISAEFEGIPYADTFAVEMRWVATRKGANDVLVEVGLFVNFKKNTIMKSQIKSGSATETKNVQLRLFDAVKRACTNPQDGASDVDDEEEEEVEDEIEGNMAKASFMSIFQNLSAHFDQSKLVPVVGAVALLFVGRYFIRAMFGNSRELDIQHIQRLENQIQELRSEVRALHKSIDSVTLLLRDMQSKE